MLRSAVLLLWVYFWMVYFLAAWPFALVTVLGLLYIRPPARNRPCRRSPT